MISCLYNFVDPNDPNGRTYKQVNAERAHQIPMGALVELDSGARLFVVQHTRDCDMEPLYCLSADAEDTEPRYKGFANPGWAHGYGEEQLTVIKTP